jgi:hypothetical protein
MSTTSVRERHAEEEVSFNDFINADVELDKDVEFSAKVGSSRLSDSP